MSGQIDLRKRVLWSDARYHETEETSLNVWNRLPKDRLLVDASIWSADLTALADEVHRIEHYADLVHIDVADAHFVPGLLFFPDLVQQLRATSPIPFHVHLMVEQPSNLIDDFVDAGVDIFTVHCEVGPDISELLQHIRARGRAPGLAIRLDTPIDEAVPYLHLVDLVLLLGTELGVKGVDLDPTALSRIKILRGFLREHGLSDQVKIEADGGLRRHTVPDLRAAGADIISPGSLVFGPRDLDSVFSWLHALPTPGELP